MAPGRVDCQPGHKKSMGKKFALVVLIALLAFVTGGVFYWVKARRAFRHFPIATSPPSQSHGPNTPVPGGAPPSALPPVPGEPGEKKNASPIEPSFSPRVGESFEYAANLAQLNSTIADLKIAVTERRDFAGKNTWHLQGLAHTNNPYRMVFELDDQFDSYSEVANLTGLQYEMHLSERGQKVEAILRLLPSPNEPPPPGVIAARVVPGTRDPLGLLYYLRGMDWAKTREVSSPVYDGRKLYDVRAVIVGKGEQVKVPAGNYTASKIEIHVFENRTEMKDAHFLLYLANDAARTPVLMEAILPVATVRVELTKAK
jgi:hypothetical protein